MLANLSRTLAKRYFSITPTSQKIATGLVGLPVSDDGMKELKEVSQSILEQIQAIPADAPYRMNVESLYQHRLKVCETSADEVAVEAALGLGNIEEVIAMGYDELSLIPRYIEGKMHEK